MASGKMLPGSIIPAGLLDKLTVEDLEKIGERFAEGEISKEKGVPRYVIEETAVRLLKERSKKTGCSFHEEEGEDFFDRIDSKNSYFLTWRKFVIHTLHLYNERAVQVIKTGFQPFHILPEIYPCVDHNDTTVAMEIFPKPDGTKDYVGGDLLNLSRTGELYFMSPDMVIVSKNHIEENKKAHLRISCTGMACLPDVNMIAIATTCWDIRFYESSPSDFKRHFSFVEFPKCVSSVHYSVGSTDSGTSSTLVAGDDGGSVYVIHINPEFVRRLRMSVTLKQKLSKVSFVHLNKKLIEGVDLVAFNKLHSESVNKVKFFPQINSFISCSSCTKEAMIVHDFSRSTEFHFKSARGILDFEYCHERGLIVTGGRDNNVKLWNRFIPRIPNSILHGHVSPIGFVVCDVRRSSIISLSKNKVVKVWDMDKGACLQTINIDLPELGRHDITCVAYNPVTAKLTVHTHHFAVFRRVDEVGDSGESETTHQWPICAAVFCKKTKEVITGAENSVVTLWNLRTGQKVFQYGNAHTMVQHDFEVPVAISAMSLDMDEKRLATGGRDGLVKIWNYNDGICLSVYQTEGTGEIPAIPVLINTFFLTSSDGTVNVVYDDGAGTVIEKPFKERQERGIKSADIHLRTGLFATASFDGEIVVWIRQMGVKKWRLIDDGSKYRKDLTLKLLKPRRKIVENNEDPPDNSDEDDTTLQQQDTAAWEASQRISKIHFLQNRPLRSDTGTLVSCGPSGVIRFWAPTPGCGVVARFHALEQSKAGLISITSDKCGYHLIAGDTAGYVRIWYIGIYCTSTRPTRLIQKDPFLDRFPYHRLRKRLEKNGFRKPLPQAPAQDQYLKSKDLYLVVTKPPPLVSCFRAHTDAVTHIECAQDPDLLMTCGYDGSVRIWRLTGSYVGCFDGQDRWVQDDLKQAPPGLKKKMPPDIRRVASPSTLKVINNGICPMWTRALRLLRDCKRKERILVPRDDKEDGDQVPPLGRRYQNGEPILGKFHQIPETAVPAPKIPPLYDINFKVSAFSHLNTINIEPTKQVEITPEIAKSLVRNGLIYRQTKKQT